MVELKKKYISLPSCKEYTPNEIAQSVTEMLDEVFHFDHIERATITGYGSGNICYLTPDDASTGIYVGYGQINSAWKLAIFLVHDSEIIEYSEIYLGGVNGYFVLEYEVNSEKQSDWERVKGGFSFHDTRIDVAPNAWGNVTCLVSRGLFKTDDIEKKIYGVYGMVINKAVLAVAEDTLYYKTLEAPTNAMADIVSLVPFHFQDTHEGVRDTIFQADMDLAVIYPRRFNSDIFYLDGAKYISTGVKMDASYLGYQRLAVRLNG